MTIPEDILLAAENSWLHAHAAHEGHNDSDPITVIAAAILAERQRCADVARKEADDYKANNCPAQAMALYQLARTIAA